MNVQNFWHINMYIYFSAIIESFSQGTILFAFQHLIEFFIIDMELQLNK